MLERKQIFGTLFLTVSVLATVFVFTEIVLQSFGKSICYTEGCRMTARYARFGDISILLTGLATFFSIAALTLLNRRMQRPGVDRLINLILIVALTGEGFFMGYLAFRIHTLCIFCVTIFSFMVVLGILRALSGERDVLAGFVTLAAAFSLHYLILPAGVTVNLPANDRLVLFYSTDCKHCGEIMKELEERNITASHLAVTEYAGFLKSMGIEHVPTLMVNDPYQKIFLTGKDAIRQYLTACAVAKKAQGGTVPGVKTGKPAVPARDTGAAIDIFNPPSLLSAPAQTAPGDGMCREEEICE